MQVPLFLRACEQQPVERAPIWIMRQAGRYLPEYRAVREKVDFLTLCRTPELACEVTLQPIQRFGFDPSILFSDIMMPLESMGIQLEFAPGPIIKNPIRTQEQIEQLVIPDAQSIAPYVYETVRLLRRALPASTALIGFCGAPLTLAAYLIEGKGSKEFSKLRAFLYQEPELGLKLLKTLGHVMGLYLREQIRAGAQAVQIFDSWAGILNESMYRQFAMPAVLETLKVIEHEPVPKIYFAQDAAAIFHVLKEYPVQVLGVDWRMSLSTARSHVGDGFTLQGNLDPTALFGSVERVKSEARHILNITQGQKHIFNLGHGILPETPIAQVQALVDTVQSFCV